MLPNVDLAKVGVRQFRGEVSIDAIPERQAAARGRPSDAAEEGCTRKIKPGTCEKMMKKPSLFRRWAR